MLTILANISTEVTVVYYTICEQIFSTAPTENYDTYLDFCYKAKKIVFLCVGEIEKKGKQKNKKKSNMNITRICFWRKSSTRIN